MSKMRAKPLQVEAPTFNRKEFAIGGKSHFSNVSPEKLEASLRQNNGLPSVQNTCIYEVVTQTVVVRAEPHNDAKMKTKKSRGSKIICSGMTMHGWLKLANEPGYIPGYIRASEGWWEVAAPVDGGSVVFAVPDYEPQGIVCLEVVFKSGVPIREEPNRNAKTLVTYNKGEYVFAQMQNFDGWVKVLGEEGWMLTFTDSWGELLRPRRVRFADMWALSDLWAAARSRGRKAHESGLSPADVQILKELEQQALHAAIELFEDHRNRGDMMTLIKDGILNRSDLDQAESWIGQRIFAKTLMRSVEIGNAAVKNLIPSLGTLTPRMPPSLPEELDWWEPQGPEEPLEDPGAHLVDEDTGEVQPLDPDSEMIEYEGKHYVMEPNGVVYDPPNAVPIGIFNPETQKIDPAPGNVPGTGEEVIAYFGKTYLTSPDGALRDADTRKLAGTFNKETNHVELISKMQQKKAPAFQPPARDLPETSASKTAAVREASAQAPTTGSSVNDSKAMPSAASSEAFELNGKRYAKKSDGMVYDPPCEVPIGMWNKKLQRIDPVPATIPGTENPAVAYFGKVYLLSPDDELIDPDTRDIVGTCDMETNDVELYQSGGGSQPAAVAASSPTRESGPEHRNETDVASTSGSGATKAGPATSGAGAETVQKEGAAPADDDDDSSVISCDDDDGAANPGPATSGSGTEPVQKAGAAPADDDDDSSVISCDDDD